MDPFIHLITFQIFEDLYLVDEELLILRMLKVTFYFF